MLDAPVLPWALWQQTDLPCASYLRAELTAGPAEATPGLVHPQETKPGNPHLSPPLWPRILHLWLAPGTGMWGPGMGLPKSRVSGDTGESFCKQMPQVSSQTGRRTRSASADLTLKIGSLMPVDKAGCGLPHAHRAAPPGQAGPTHTGKALGGDAGTSWFCQVFLRGFSLLLLGLWRPADVLEV